jgi:hypothetical protein
MVASRAQEKQGPSHFVAQQAPWAQMPLAHSLSVAQGCCSVLPPQNPSRHGFPAAQSSAVAQKVWQSFVCGSQAYGKQENVSRWQVPAPSQAPAPLQSEPEQEEDPQETPAG